MQKMILMFILLSVSTINATPTIRVLSRSGQSEIIPVPIHYIEYGKNISFCLSETNKVGHTLLYWEDPNGALKPLDKADASERCWPSKQGLMLNDRGMHTFYFISDHRYSEIKNLWKETTLTKQKTILYQDEAQDFLSDMARKLYVYPIITCDANFHENKDDNQKSKGFKSCQLPCKIDMRSVRETLNEQQTYRQFCVYSY